ncbi:unnamed protein product [Bursaphelenchus xylophilus]|uniref:(pine wood nematode) hypothetical protein n=1 Tax=Bursaphelenchus xylophilus TaxID=6326 RepID=A0A1I7SC73_BURXY|nr:unnamed protein product [Bursaphelenchus xylophilus]CAG9094626.1 unnamed protein product [Bursaphelenchus xylophilus]
MVSFLLSSLVIFLSYRVNKRSPQREYAWIMAFNASVDIFSSLYNGLVAPSAVSTSSTMYMIFENPFLQNISASTARAAAFFLEVASLCSAPCNAIHFYYRYRLLCKGDMWSKQRYLTAYGMALAVIFVIATLFCASGNLANERSRQELIAISGGGYPVHPHVFVTLDDPTFMLCALLCLLGYVGEYGLIIFCGQRIIRQAREGISSATASTQKAQKHLITVMILQAVYPLILYFSPIVYVTAMLAMGVQFRNSGYLTAVSLQLLSPLNAISVLTLIPAYRRVFTKKPPTNSGTYFISVSR